MRRLLLLSAGLVALAATIAAVPFQSNKECPGDELYTQYPDADDCKRWVDVQAIISLESVS